MLAEIFMLRLEAAVRAAKEAAACRALRPDHIAPGKDDITGSARIRL